MTLNVLDTVTLSDFEQGHPQVMARILARPIAEIAITVITVEEQFAGRLSYLRRARATAEVAAAYLKMTNTVRVFTGFHVMTFSEAAILRYHSLLSMKLNVGGMDLKIAAIALEEDATVITRNVRDFERVPGLKYENWAD